MKNFVKLFLTACISSSFIYVQAQTNSNIPARVDSTKPASTRNANQAVPASHGTEPNNRIMQRAQTDSMNVNIKSPAPVRTIPDSTRNNRNGINNNPVRNVPVYPEHHRDSLK